MQPLGGLGTCTPRKFSIFDALRLLLVHSQHVRLSVLRSRVVVCATPRGGANLSRGGEYPLPPLNEENSCRNFLKIFHYEANL